MHHNVAGVQPCFVGGRNVPVSVTGTTSEVELARIVLPPYALGTSGLLRLSYAVAATNNANVKTLRLRCGPGIGTLMATTTAITSTLLMTGGWVCIATPTSIRGNASMAAPFTTIAAALSNVANDWSTETELMLSGQLANGADTMTLEWLIWEGFRF